MPNTYSKLYCHVVFSTKNREPHIDSEISKKLYPYFSGIAQNAGYRLVLGNGTNDHVHLILEIPPRLSLAEIMRLSKSNSSKWIHDSFPAKKSFAWQNGYAAFSVSHSNLQTVYRYIQGQKEHHAKASYKDELVALLERHRVNYDEQYLWD